MAKGRLPMRQLRQILKLKYHTGLTHREIVEGITESPQPPAPERQRQATRGNQQPKVAPIGHRIGQIAVNSPLQM